MESAKTSLDEVMRMGVEEDLPLVSLSVLEMGNRSMTLLNEFFTTQV